jgi:SAM-dependent methyltransferase
MMFRERATQPEHFDDPSRTFEEFRLGYAQLARVNRLFRLHDPYTRVMCRWLGSENCRDLAILDLGAGDGWLGNAIEDWASTRGWRWRVTNLDCNPAPLRLCRDRRNIAASALALPFEDDAFDVVIASQMTHHFNSDADVVRHFREAWRVAARAVFLTDMRRNAFLYTMLWLALPLLRINGKMRADGLLSVKKGWTLKEWRELAWRAGIPGAAITNYYGSRIILAARKQPASAAANETTEPYHAVDEFCSAPSGK